MSTDDLTDSQVERALRGDSSASPDLAPAIGSLRALAREPQADSAGRVGAVLASVAAGSAVPLIAPAAAAPIRWRRRAAVAAGVALLGAGLFGTAAAADDAAPGELLYPVDQALAGLGVGDGGTEEACDEAVKMAEDGDVEGAVEHLAETAEDDGELDEGSAAALMAAAERIRENGSEQSAAVHQRVAAMLEWMATTDATGKEFGQGVAARARGLIEEPAVDDAEAGVDADVPTAPGRSGDAPGQAKKQSPAPAESADADQPTEPSAPGNSTGGKPSKTPQPAGTGKPADAGKPEGVGKP